MLMPIGTATGTGTGTGISLCVAAALLALAGCAATPRDVLGYHIGAPRKLTYYVDQLKYYRALAAASPRVKVETIGRSDEGRELVVVWISSEANMQRLDQNRKNRAKIADPRGMSEAQVKAVLADTKPHYHLLGGLHSGETGPSEMLMELAYRLVTETSPLVSQIREQLYVSMTPAADADAPHFDAGRGMRFGAGAVVVLPPVSVPVAGAVVLPLVPVVAGNSTPEPVVYGESLFGAYRFGWTPLTSLIVGGQSSTIRS